MAKKIIVVMPAYNAELTLEKTYRDMPKGLVSETILCDDESKDRTVEIAKRLELTVLAHDKNKGYGGNQKTLYKEALKRKPAVIVMLHPDYQYDSKKIPELVQPILDNRADIVLGSRMLEKGALKSGMPFYKYISNKFLTFCQNKALGLNLSEYHTGLRAYSREFLEKVDWSANSDDFLFDAQMLIKAARLRLRITEIPIETRYFREASQVSFFAGMKYGFGILCELIKYGRYE
jgi:glycosyltransferase involved in cell wall biosynthesis